GGGVAGRLRCIDHGRGRCRARVMSGARWCVPDGFWPQKGQGVTRNGVVSGEFPGAAWSEVSAPASAGWDVERLAEARGIARGADSSALMVVHRGQVVLSYGAFDRPTIVASVRKSLLSALYG